MRALALLLAATVASAAPSHAPRRAEGSGGPGVRSSATGEITAAVDRAVPEDLVARVDGQWKVVDRSPGGAFDDASLAERYAGFFDDPTESR